MKYIYYYTFPFCKLGIAEENSAISRIFFEKGKPSKDFEKKETSLIKKTAKELDEYFNGKRKTFDVPVALYGSDFTVKTWEALCAIPYGETRSYGEVAAMVGNPKACRAVGLANNRNPIPIIVPCHRVIGKNGSLTGYALGLETKKRLLDHER